MLNFPQRTLFNKRIPKEKFYEHLTLTTVLKKKFIDEIDTIHWLYKFSNETINLQKGKVIDEIQFLKIRLKTKKVSESILKQIGNVIPYHIIYIITYNNECMLCAEYKERISDVSLKVNTYYYSEWKDINSVSLEINGLDLDKVYENFILQIAPKLNEIKTDDIKNIKDLVNKSKELDKLNKQIERLDIISRKEKQSHKKLELYDKMQKLIKTRDRLVIKE